MIRRGVTLIELMVALAITMIIMGAVVTLFGNMTNSVTDSRAVIEISERLRAARNQLQLDLVQHTAITLPPRKPESGEGYLEIIEGPNFDCFGNVTPLVGNTTPLTYSTLAVATVPATAPASTSPTRNSIMGDSDDMLMLTVRSRSEPFTGHALDSNTPPNAVMAQSQDAEVIWFALPNGKQIPTLDSARPIQLYTLYRRVLLVLPQANVTTAAGGPAAPIPTLYANANPGITPAQPLDVSTRFDLITNQNVANSLGDLTKRENRYLHGTPGNNPPSGFPFRVNTANIQGSVFGASPSIYAVPSTARIGDEVVLTDVLAFDIKVWDPSAPIKVIGTISVVNTDPGFAPPAVSPVQLGGYVDMGYAFNLPASLKAAVKTGSGFFNTGWGFVAANVLSCTYDTYSTHYEQNGMDEDGNGNADQGTNGLDDGSNALPPVNGIIDDKPDVYLGLNSSKPYGNVASYGELETIAPYPIPLRGVQITLRVYEPSTRQVRQVSVIQDFLPE